MSTCQAPKLFFVFYFWKDYSNNLNRLNLNILFSAGHHYRQGRFTVANMGRYNELFMDSGGFQLIGKYGEYPFSNKDYLEYVEIVNPDYVAPLDYPCDGLDRLMPQIKLTNQERISKTVANTMFLMDNYERQKVVPVIQGYSLDEYKSCIEQLEAAGLVKDYMAVGSVCIRKKPAEVYEILKVCDEMTGAKLHVFGLNLNFVKQRQIRNLVESFDTMAWMYNSTRYGRVFTFTGKRMVKLHTKGPSEPKERVRLDDEEIQWLTLRAYKEYYDYLCEQWAKQAMLR